MKRTRYPIHSDFRGWSKLHPPLNKAMLPLMQKMLGLLWLLQKSTKELTVTKKRITTFDGSKIRVLLYSPVGIPENAPCLMYYHGGGFVFPAAPNHYHLAGEYALKARCKVLFVDYRLAPKYPFPIAPEDCYAAYRWAIENAGELSIDPARIAVTGDSAGAQLAIVVCLMARDRGLAMPCGQLLPYPAVGNLPDTESYQKYTDTPMCCSKDMDKYGRYYIQDEKAGKREYSSPIHAESFEGLPPAYIETAQFDPLHDGGVLYAQRLISEGIAAELTETQGTIHGFDIVLNSPIVRKCIDARIDFLKRIFGGNK